MDVAARSRTWVEDFLADLDAEYDGFAVTQRTVELPADRYRRACDLFESRMLAAYLDLRNGAEQVLHLPTEDGHALPRRCGSPDDALAADLRDLVHERTALRCEVDGLDSLAILGVRSDGDPDAEPVYHPLPVFRGRRIGGELAGDGVWRDTRSAINPFFG